MMPYFCASNCKIYFVIAFRSLLLDIDFLMRAVTGFISPHSLYIFLLFFLRHRRYLPDVGSAATTRRLPVQRLRHR